MEKRTIIIRRKEVMNHLPKEIRAGAKVKLGSMFVDRLPLKGVEGKEDRRKVQIKDVWMGLGFRV